MYTTSEKIMYGVIVTSGKYNRNAIRVMQDLLVCCEYYDSFNAVTRDKGARELLVSECNAVGKERFIGILREMIRDME